MHEADGDPSTGAKGTYTLYYNSAFFTVTTDSDGRHVLAPSSSTGQTPGDKLSLSSGSTTLYVWGKSSTEIADNPNQSFILQYTVNGQTTPVCEQSAMCQPNWNWDNVKTFLKATTAGQTAINTLKKNKIPIVEVGGDSHQGTLQQYVGVKNVPYVFYSGAYMWKSKQQKPILYLSSTQQTKFYALQNDFDAAALLVHEATHALQDQERKPNQTWTTQEKIDYEVQAYTQQITFLNQVLTSETLKLPTMQLQLLSALIASPGSRYSQMSDLGGYSNGVLTSITPNSAKIRTFLKNNPGYQSNNRIKAIDRGYGDKPLSLD